RRRVRASTLTRSSTNWATARPRLQPSTSVEYGAFEALTFDCYGTLIDWEAGLSAAFRPVLFAHEIEVSDEDVLERYARHEAELEAGPYLRYRDILAGALRGVLAEFGAEPSAEEAAVFGGSVGHW